MMNKDNRSANLPQHAEEPECDQPVDLAGLSTEELHQLIRELQVHQKNRTVELVTANEKLRQEIVECRQAQEELTILNEISQIISATTDLQAQLTLITDYLTQLLGVAAVALVLRDPVANDLYLAAVSGPVSDFMQGRRLALGQGIVGWVIEHGQPVLAPDVFRDSRFYSDFDRESGFTTRAILCVPLRTKRGTIGAIEVINKKGEPFDQDDLRLLSLLAAPAAIAIENARLFEQVQAGRERLQTLSRRLVEVQETERRHIARELHDEASQALTSLMVGLGLLERETSRPESIRTRVAELKRITNDVLENLHQLAVNLRPTSLDRLGLEAALSQYAETFSRQHGLPVQFEAVGLDSGRLPPAVETALYRIVQEALINIIRHARATRVDVLLKQRADRTIIVVEDDGVGFDTEMVVQNDRLGILGMQDRAEMLGGSLVVESSPGTGTTLFVEVPYGHSYPDRG